MEELNPSIESPEKAELRKLESEGVWVFHGSGKRLEALEPKQAINSSTGKPLEDGAPAVFASPSADLAIFMALVNKHNAPEGAHSAFSTFADGSAKFKATPETMSQIKNARGYVYVLKKDGFIEKTKLESISENSVEPEKVIEVTDKDLPQVEITNLD